MRKVVFLDIDGVLNSTEHFLAFRAEHGRNPMLVPVEGGIVIPGDTQLFLATEHIFQDSIAVLNRIVAEANPEWIISSTWRNFCDVGAVLAFHGFLGKVIGNTPQKFTSYRVNEIAWACESHGFTGDDRVIVIDDIDFMGDLDHLATVIKTDPSTGITEFDAYLAIAALNR